MKTFRIIALSCFLIITAPGSSVMAQCAMCKATVESNLSGEKTIGKGLNNGILYLMTIPYIILGSFGYMVYKNRKGRA